MKIIFGCYCKIYTENFSDECEEPKEMEENDIIEFLLDDCNCSFDDEENLIKGDINLWYLGTNEKHGYIQVNDKEWKWGWGGSSWDIIREMINEFKKLGMSEDNLKKLNDAFKEGAINFSFMYDISNYLQNKNSNIKWEHPGNEGREHSKKFFNNIIDSLSKKGIKITTP